MGQRLDALVDRIRSEKGPFFVARVALRMKSPLTRGDVPDSPESERELVEACRSLGYDPTRSDS